MDSQGEQLLFFMFLSSIFTVSNVKKKTCVPEYNLNFKSNIFPPPIVLTMYNQNCLYTIRTSLKRYMGDLLLVNESVTVQGKRKFVALKLSKESWWNTQANTNLVYVGVHREVTKLS